MAALQGILGPEQAELLSYLFQPPEVFQQNPINQLFPQPADTGATPVEQPFIAPPGGTQAPGRVPPTFGPDPTGATPVEMPTLIGGQPGEAKIPGQKYGGVVFQPPTTYGETPQEPAPGKDKAGAQITQPSSPEPGTGVTPPPATAPPPGAAAPPAAVKPPAATTQPPAATGGTTAVRPWTPPVAPPPTGTIGTPIAGKGPGHVTGYWDPGDATHPPRFIKSS